MLTGQLSSKKKIITELKFKARNLAGIENIPIKLALDKVAKQKGKGNWSEFLQSLS